MAIKYGSDFTRPINYTWNVIDGMKGISKIQFINLGLVLLIISLNIELQSTAFKFVKNPTGFLQGQHADFSSAWFLDTGHQIVLFMVLEIAIPHLLPLLQIIYYRCRKVHDRGCCKDSRISKKFFQSDYEDLYVGPEFDLDARLAQIVVFTWVTYMYSVGMPILFLISAMNFALMYWVDKWLILRFYKLPRNYDETTMHSTLHQLNYSFLFHLVIGVLMISNSGLLPTSEMVSLSAEQDDVG